MTRYLVLNQGRAEINLPCLVYTYEDHLKDEEYCGMTCIDQLSKFTFRCAFLFDNALRILAIMCALIYSYLKL